MVKAPDKLARQMEARGWTAALVAEAVRHGEQHAVRNTETAGPATRYIHPVTQRSVVIDDTTGEVIHVGGDGFLY